MVGVLGGRGCEFRVYGWKWARSGAGILSIAIVVISFPGLPPPLGGARLIRLVRTGRFARLFRTMRPARIGGLGSRALACLSRILDPDALPFATFAVLAVIVFGAAEASSQHHDAQ